MSKNMRLVAASLGALLICSLLISFRGKSQNNRQGKTRTDEVPFGQAAKDLDDAARPTVDFDDPRNTDKTRKLKNSRYDKHGAVKAEPGSDTVEVTWDAEWTAGLSDLPADKSDLVIQGIVSDSQAFLSEDRSGVYSEFTVRVSRVWKAGDGLSTSLGDMIVTERFGGKVRYPSGQVVLYRVDGQGTPILGKEYLFFLAKADPGNFKLLTAYEIQGQRIFALDGSRINFRGKGNWKFDQHNGQDLATFLETVERTINNIQAGSRRP